MFVQSGGRVFLLMIILLLLAGCDVFAPLQTPTATLRGALVPTRIPTETATATYTPSRTPTSTVTPITPTATRTPTSTRTPTQAIPTATATPSSTLVSTMMPTRQNLVAPSATPLALTQPSSSPTSPSLSSRATATRSGDVIEIPDDAVFSYSGSIDRRNFDDWFVFEADAGQQVNISMAAESGDLDPYLLLLNALGDVLIENDDDPQADTRDAFIHDFIVPATGQYTLIATRFRHEQGSTSGNFTLTVSFATASTDVTVTPTANDGRLVITSGDILEGTLNDDTPTYEYHFEVDSGTIIEIELTALSGNLDAYLLVLNAAGEVVFENDDDPQGSGRDAYIREFQLPEAGQYTIVATRFQQAQGSTSGDFRLRFAILDE